MEATMNRRPLNNFEMTDAKKLAFILQGHNNIEERILVNNLGRLIKRTPQATDGGFSFPRLANTRQAVFNRKAELIIQRIIQEPEDLNKYNTQTHLKELLGNYGDELTIIDEISTQAEKSHAIIRQVWETAALDSEPWYNNHTELVITVIQLVESFPALKLKMLLNNRSALKSHWMRELDVLRKRGEEQEKEDAAIERAIQSFASPAWLSNHLREPYPEVLSCIIQRQFLGRTPDIRQEVINIFRTNSHTITRNANIQMGGLGEDVLKSWELLTQLKLSAALDYKQFQVNGITVVKDLYQAACKNRPLFELFLVTCTNKWQYKHCPECEFSAPTTGDITRHRRRIHQHDRRETKDQNNNTLGSHILAGGGV